MTVAQPTMLISVARQSRTPIKTTNNYFIICLMRMFPKLIFCVIFSQLLRRNRFLPFHFQHNCTFLFFPGAILLHASWYIKVLYDSKMMAPQILPSWITISPLAVTMLINTTGLVGQSASPV